MQIQPGTIEKEFYAVGGLCIMPNQFLTNYTEMTFLEKIRRNLHSCRSFDFSVSFIKKAGLVLLKKEIEAALARGCSGRLITSTYQNFTDIESLKWFLGLMSSYPRFECHLDDECFHDDSYTVLGYHSKGYLFRFDDSCELVVGSSNITRYALLKNIEWDVVIQEGLDSEVYAQALAEYEIRWQGTHLLNGDLIAGYATHLNYAIERWDMDYDLSSAEIKPNFMQRKALKELNRYRAVGTSRALVVAAAGSGKTYLAAFDALNFNPKRLLYIVHEESILKKSLDTFRQVFGSRVTYGLYSGSSKECNADFVFATNVIMSRNLDLFRSDEFDYIVIDECHHATAETYRHIMSYFQPEFLLGLTATPERMDNQDVFELFQQNVPYELRLRDAIVNDLVVPFHYFGIRDSLVEYGLEQSQERQMIAQIAGEENCSFIADQIEAHRPEGKLKALAFCRSITHARMMSEAMSGRYHTAYLTGHNDVGERLAAYQDLQSDSSPLEILFTVDILNEGVDIPGVNMVLFLRPTESSTVFIQQLGRGLRKYENKQYVTVLDFIGNSYRRSAQIAFALSSLAQNFVVEKRLMASLVRDNFSALGLAEYGVEIHIDQKSQEEILRSIDNVSFNSMRYLMQDYLNFKKYINSSTWPGHMDYLNNDCAPDLIRFLSVKSEGKKNCSYYNFLRSVQEEGLPTFSEAQIAFINDLSGYLPLVRRDEYEIVRCLMDGPQEISSLSGILTAKIPGFTYRELEHALRFMKHLSRSGSVLSLNVEMDDQLREYLDDLLEYGLTRYSIDIGDTSGFKLWQSYRMDQVQLKLLQNPGYTMLGTYYYDDYTVIFASLKKDASVEERLNYKDRFLQPSLFQWESKTNLSDSDLTKLKQSRFAYLFIRKVESEGGIVLPFTYVGKGRLTNPRKTEGTNGTWLFDIVMEESLPDYLQYDFGLAKLS